MRVKTRLFGEIDIEDNKIIVFDKGIVGFPLMKKFSLIFDAEGEGEKNISWLQSMEEPEFAMPVINPLYVKEDYNPMFAEEALSGLGEIKGDNAVLLVTVTVPADIEQLSVNLKAPIVINGETLKAAQIIVEDEYPVKYNIYKQIKENKEKEGE